MKTILKVALSLSIGCHLMAAHGETPKDVSAFVMRIDDNHSPADWRKVADIFERHGMRCSFAVVSASLTESQGACLKELSARGHVIMDHTPNHAFYTLTYHDKAAYEHAKRLPFVHEADDAKLTLRFDPEVDETHSGNRRLKAKIEGNVLTFLDKDAPRRMFYNFIRIPGRKGIFGFSVKDGKMVLRDFWRRPLKEKLDVESCEVLFYAQEALQPCDDLLRELAKASRERFDHFRLPRPRIWVRPGGWEPGIDCHRLERIYGREFGYEGADSSIGGKWDASRWTSGYSAMYFFDQGADITPEKLVAQIEGKTSKGRHHVTLSHMWCHLLPGKMNEYYEKAERFATLIEERKIPTSTMDGLLKARFGPVSARPADGRD